MESAQSLPGHGPADARRTALAKLQAVNTALASRIGIQPCESQNSEGPLRTLLKKCLRCCTELRDTELELAECERAVEKAEGSVWSVKTRRIAVAGTCTHGTLVVDNIMGSQAVFSEDGFNALKAHLSTHRSLAVHLFPMHDFAARLVEAELDRAIDVSIATTEKGVQGPLHGSLEDLFWVCRINGSQYHPERFTASVHRWLRRCVHALADISTPQDNLFLMQHFARTTRVATFAAGLVTLPAGLRDEEKLVLCLTYFTALLLGPLQLREAMLEASAEPPPVLGIGARLAEHDDDAKAHVPSGDAGGTWGAWAYGLGSAVVNRVYSGPGPADPAPPQGSLIPPVAELRGSSGGGWEVVNTSPSDYVLEEADFVALFEAIPFDTVRQTMLDGAESEGEPPADPDPEAELPLLYSFLQICGAGLAAYPAMPHFGRLVAQAASSVIRELFTGRPEPGGAPMAGANPPRRCLGAVSVLRHLRVLLHAPGQSLWPYLPEIPFEALTRDESVAWRILAELCLGGSLPEGTEGRTEDPATAAAFCTTAEAWLALAETPDPTGMRASLARHAAVVPTAPHLLRALGELGARARIPELATAVVVELVEVLQGCSGTPGGNQEEGPETPHREHPCWEGGTAALRVVTTAEPLAASTLLKAILRLAEHGAAVGLDLVEALPFVAWALSQTDVALLATGLMAPFETLQHAAARRCLECVSWGGCGEVVRLGAINSLHRAFLAHCCREAPELQNSEKTPSQGGKEIVPGSPEGDEFEDWLWRQYEVLTAQRLPARWRRCYHTEEYAVLRGFCELPQPRAFSCGVALGTTDVGTDPLLLGVYEPLWQALLDSGRLVAAAQLLLAAVQSAPGAWLERESTVERRRHFAVPLLRAAVAQDASGVEVGKQVLSYIGAGDTATRMGPVMGSLARLVLASVEEAEAEVAEVAEEVEEEALLERRFGFWFEAAGELAWSLRDPSVCGVWCEALLEGCDRSPRVQLRRGCTQRCLDRLAESRREWSLEGAAWDAGQGYLPVALQGGLVSSVVSRLAVGASYIPGVTPRGGDEEGAKGERGPVHWLPPGSAARMPYLSFEMLYWESRQPLTEEERGQRASPPPRWQDEPDDGASLSSAGGFVGRGLLSRWGALGVALHDGHPLLLPTWHMAALVCEAQGGVETMPAPERESAKGRLEWAKLGWGKQRADGDYNTAGQLEELAAYFGISRQPADPSKGALKSLARELPGGEFPPDPAFLSWAEDRAQLAKAPVPPAVATAEVGESPSPRGVQASLEPDGRKNQALKRLHRNGGAGVQLNISVFPQGRGGIGVNIDLGLDAAGLHAYRRVAEAAPERLSASFLGPQTPCEAGGTGKDTEEPPSAGASEPASTPPDAVEVGFHGHMEALMASAESFHAATQRLLTLDRAFLAGIQSMYGEKCTVRKASAGCCASCEGPMVRLYDHYEAPANHMIPNHTLHPTFSTTRPCPTSSWSCP